MDYSFFKSVIQLGPLSTLKPPIISEAIRKSEILFSKVTLYSGSGHNFNPYMLHRLT